MLGFAGQIDVLADRLRSLVSGWSGAELTVVEGAHRGACVALGRDPLQIGADANDDVVLFADELAPEHAEIAVVGPLGNSLKVIARGAAVEAEGVGRIAPGFEATLPMPARLTLGSARIEARSRSPLALAPTSSHMLSAAFVAASLLAGGLVAVAASDWSGSAVAETTSTLDMPAQTHVGEQRLRDLIETAGLSGMVKLELGPDGAPVLSGKLEGERAATAWRSLLVSLDAEPGARRLINMVTVDRDAAKPPAVGSVWRDARPRVIFTNGERISLGDKTSTGWTVSEISVGGVTLLSPAGAPYRVSVP